jgi:hypothetical protein
MTDNYEKIVQDNLKKRYDPLPPDLDQRLSATHTEQVLVPHVPKITAGLEVILRTLKGETAPAGTSGDTSFVVYPLPKIALCYILYEADEDFPAAVTCLYSSNACQFMPIDGLADVGEYTSKKIIDLVT